MATRRKTAAVVSGLEQLPLDHAQRAGLAQALAAGDRPELAAALGDAHAALERLQSLNARFAALRKEVKIVRTVDKLPAYAVIGGQQMMVSE